MASEPHTAHRLVIVSIQSCAWTDPEVVSIPQFVKPELYPPRVNRGVFQQITARPAASRASMCRLPVFHHEARKSRPGAARVSDETSEVIGTV
jgi:hypothetical protein